MQITVFLPNLSPSLKTGIAYQKTTKVTVVKYVTPDVHALLCLWALHTPTKTALWHCEFQSIA